MLQPQLQTLLRLQRSSLRACCLHSKSNNQPIHQLSCEPGWGVGVVEGLGWAGLGWGWFGVGVAGVNGWGYGRNRMGGRISRQCKHVHKTNLMGVSIKILSCQCRPNIALIHTAAIICCIGCLRTCALASRHACTFAASDSTYLQHVL